MNNLEIDINNLSIQLKKSDFTLSKDKGSFRWNMPNIYNIFSYEQNLANKMFCLLLGYAQKYNNFINKNTKEDYIRYYTDFTFSLNNLRSKDHIFKDLKKSKLIVAKTLINLVDNPIVNLININAETFTVRVSIEYLNFDKNESYVFEYEKIRKLQSKNRIKAFLLCDYYSKFNFHTIFLAEFFDLPFYNRRTKCSSTYLSRKYLLETGLCEKVKYHNGKRKGDNKFFLEMKRITRVITNKVKSLSEQLFETLNTIPRSVSKESITNKKRKILKYFEKQRDLNRSLNKINKSNLLLE